MKTQPEVLLSELARVSTPVAATAAAAAPEAQAVSNRAAADALMLCAAPPPPAAVARLQDCVSAQLQPGAPHTPGQLASAGSLYVAAAPRTPPAAVPRAAALLAAAARGAAGRADAEPAAATEVLYVCDHGLQALCAAHGAAAPPAALPRGACTSMQADLSPLGAIGASHRLLATGRPQEGGAAADAAAAAAGGSVDRCAAPSATMHGDLGSTSIRSLERRSSTNHCTVAPVKFDKR